MVAKQCSVLVIANLILAAGLNAQSTTVTVTATPASASFSYQMGATSLPKPQKVSIKASSGTSAFTTAVTDPSAMWLTVTPNSGQLPGSLSIYVNPTSLAVAQYTSSITVTLTDLGTVLTIPVTLNVTPGSSTLSLSPTTLIFSAPPSPVSTQTLQLSTDREPISFTAASGATWMSVTPTVGVVLPGGPITLTVSVDPTSLTPQSTPYTGKITVTQVSGTSAAKGQSATVSFTVSSSTPYIATVWPGTLPLTSVAQTITITGGNFYNATVASLQGVATPLKTTVLSPSALLAIVPASQLTTAVTLNLVVTNPLPGGASGPYSLTVANIPSIQAITNVASYGSASVSPGELVTIFGTNIGPAVPVPMSIVNGFVATSLGGVSLTIDDQPAPLLYVSPNQVTAQVPYEVTQGTGKQVILTNGTLSPANSTVTVTATAPGIFTADGSGENGAAALNFSATTSLYTLNTSSNAAYVGDTILLYLTGEGDYNPTLSPRTGLVVPTSLSPLPELNPLPTVTIGGANATVAYAGPIVGSILGLVQINCVVPTGATTGKAVPVLVSIGSTSTQTGVTLSIHP